MMNIMLIAIGLLACAAFLLQLLTSAPVGCQHRGFDRKR
jgi:hypothetical protein